MVTEKNGGWTSKRVVSAVVAGIIMLLIGGVLANQSEVAVLKSKVQAIEKMLDESKTIMERNRQENNQAHEKILDELRKK